MRRLPSAFTATLQVEPENRYFRHAIAVMAAGEKVGYVAPEVARSYYERVRDAAGPLTCQGRRGRHIDHESSGVELFLDLHSACSRRRRSSGSITSKSMVRVARRGVFAPRSVTVSSRR